jgi:hypothetical protein
VVVEWQRFPLITAITASSALVVLSVLMSARWKGGIVASSLAPLFPPLVALLLFPLVPDARDVEMPASTPHWLRGVARTLRALSHLIRGQFAVTVFLITVGSCVVTCVCWDVWPGLLIMLPTLAVMGAVELLVVAMHAALLSAHHSIEKRGLEGSLLIAGTLAFLVATAMKW